MRIIYNNRWDVYTLTESQEDSNYPAENTQDTRLAKTWRTQTASAATIIINAGSGVTITANCAAIINHNFNASAGISIQASTTATFVTIALSANIAYSSDYRTNVLLVFFTSGSYRYWRFNFNNTTNPDGYYEIGRLMLGTYLQITPSSLVEFPEDQPRSDRQTFSVTNQLYSDVGIGHREYRYSFENVDDDMKQWIEYMWYFSGKKYPILFMNYDTNYAEIPPVYCVIAQDMTFTHLKHDYWKYDLVLREVD